MRLHHLSIRAKLLAGFIVLIVLATLQSLLSMQRLSTVNDDAASVNAKWVAGMRILGEVSQQLAHARAARLSLLLTDSDDAVKALEKELGEIAKRVDAGRAAYAQLVTSPEERALFDPFDKAWTDFQALLPGVLKMVRELDMSGAKSVLLSNGHQTYQAADQALTRLVEYNAAGTREAADHVEVVLLRDIEPLIRASMGSIWLSSALGSTPGGSMPSGRALHNGLACTTKRARPSAVKARIGASHAVSGVSKYSAAPTKKS